MMLRSGFTAREFQLGNMSWARRKFEAFILLTNLFLHIFSFFNDSVRDDHSPIRETEEHSVASELVPTKHLSSTAFSCLRLDTLSHSLDPAGWVFDRFSCWGSEIIQRNFVFELCTNITFSRLISPVDQISIFAVETVRKRYKLKSTN